MSESSLMNMSYEELKNQARILGISLKGNPSADTLREAIRSETTESEEGGAEVEVVDLKKDWVTIEIAESEREQSDVFVGVNGRNFHIKRGIPVAVPPEVEQVLASAKQTVYEGKDMRPRKVPRHPYRVIRG